MADCDVCGRAFDPDDLHRELRALDRQACDACSDYRLEFGHWPDEDQTTFDHHE